MAKKDYKSEFQERPGEDPKIHGIIYRLAEKPIYKFTKRELDEMLTYLQREVRIRMSEIRKAGLEYDSPAYMYIKKNKISTYKPRSGNSNAYRKAVKDAVDFLHSKTSTVKGASEYSDWQEENIGRNLTKREKKIIWKNIHDAETNYSNKFVTHGYGYVMKRIAEETKKSGFSRFDENKIKEIMGTLSEERKVEIKEAQSEVDMPWNKGEDLQKEYNNL